MRRLAHLFPFFLAAACAREGGVRVSVKLGSFRPACLELVATNTKTGEQRVTKVEKLANPAQANIALVTSRELTVSLELRAHEKSCAGNVVETLRPAEPFHLVPGKFTEWAATLTAEDADQDLWAARGPGITGSDCDDTSAETYPGAVELCAADVDRDCDGLSRCADSDCAGSFCDDQDPCTQGDVCAQGLCRGTAAVCNAPPNVDCYGQGSCGADGGCEYQAQIGRNCGDGGACRSDGTCIIGEVDCQDGVDNDQDGNRDCLDADCYLQLCSDGNPCTVGDRCPASAGSCQGTPRVCNTPPPGQCWLTQGTCSNGNCVYSAQVGRACNDGQACTGPDTCRADGGCVGPTFTCNNPPAPQCYVVPGACQPNATCRYAVDAGARCNDQAACTHSDVCEASGTCRGTSYACPAPSECFDAGVCLGDGTCQPVVRVGQTCGQGVCQPDGGCQAAGTAFPYSPSNFQPQNYVAGGNATFSNCAAVFDSTNASFVSACPGAAAPRVYQLTAGGTQVVLLTFQGLTLNSNASLHLRGSRPVILAVYGDAKLDGPIYANSSQQDGGVGPGGDMSSCTNRSGGPGLGGATKGGGGGGAGLGTAGADGGSGDNGNAGAGFGGLAYAGTLPSPLVGGCPGGTGGANGGGVGGSGGGALQLSVAGRLEGNAIITASGAGGVGGNGNDSGGGGAGSGGLIVLEANELLLQSSARLTANGGGGGGGTHGGPGGSGQDGLTDSATPATGGSGSGGGGQGGQGGAGTTAPNTGESVSRGGGGGGGAVGAVYLRHASTTVNCQVSATVISPPATRVGCP